MRLRLNETNHPRRLILGRNPGVDNSDSRIFKISHITSDQDCVVLMAYGSDLAVHDIDLPM